MNKNKKTSYRGRGKSSGNYSHKNRNKFRSRGRGSRRRSNSVTIDISKFINKAVPHEEVEAFEPVHTFSDFAIDTQIKKNLESLGFTLPTPIQDEAIPHILEGRDVVGIANTGTGKTLAFLIPLVHHTLKVRDKKVLVVAPTRELAQQIEEELRMITKHIPVSSVICVGGTSMGRQLSGLRRPHSFVVGTPGRLKDLLERGKLKLNEFDTVVLDEADRMLDMGFIQDIEFLLSHMVEKRHTLFFSATMSKTIQSLISRFLQDPVHVSVKTQETSKHVEQDVVRVRGRSKTEVLASLLGEGDFDKVLIFGRTKRGVDKLSRDLSKQGFKTDAIHGDKSQARRQKALKRFKDDYINILVATDVAARGLDIPDVSHVINYDIPEVYEDYVHRIGRTGRAGKRGKALTFVE